MKKLLNILVFLLLAASIGFNVYQYLNNNKEDEEEETKTKYVIKSDVISYSEEELNKKLINISASQFVNYLSDEIIKNSLDEDEIDDATSEAKSQMEELETYYGDELEEVIKTNTNYSSKKEYLEVLKVSVALDKRAEKACKKEDDVLSCEDIKRAEISYDFLKDANVKFNDKTLEKEWDNLLEQYEEYIEDAKQTPVSPSSDGLLEIDLKELRSKIDNLDTFILVVGQTTCSHCQTFIPKMEEVAKENGITVYLIEIDELSYEDHQTFNEMFDVSGTPTTLIIENGIVTDKLAGDVTKSRIEEFLQLS